MSPFIPDNGDGVDINHLIDNSEAGAWSKELARLAQMGCGPVCDPSSQFTKTNPVPQGDGGRGFSAPFSAPADSLSVSHDKLTSPKGPHNNGS